MQKRTLGDWLGFVGSGLAMLAASCYSASLDEPASTPVASKTEAIIGGFGANNSALNAVGSLNIQYLWGYSEYLCTAVLVTENMVLTARQCAERLAYGLSTDARAVFAIGPSAYAPAKQVDVIHYELPPASSDPYTSYDVAVLHLGEPVTDVPPLPWAMIDESTLGEKFVGIGYGIQNTNYSSGTRKLGSLTLRATSGRLYEAVFGSFEAYFKWNTGYDLPSDCELGNSDDAGVPPPDGGSGGRGGAGGKGGYGGDASYNWLCDEAIYLREYYDSVRLEPSALAIAGGLSGEAQPCEGDGGGPLLRMNDGQLTVYAILSGGMYANAPNKICDFGAIYSAFDKTMLGFIEQAKDWVDPCAGLSSVGQCSGTVAERCSGFGEGDRRRLAFDCADVGLTCETQNDGSIGCGADESFFPGMPVIDQTAAPDINSQLFRSPMHTE
jgi:hypothetical protein